MSDTTVVSTRYDIVDLVKRADESPEKLQIQSQGPILLSCNHLQHKNPSAPIKIGNRLQLWKVAQPSAIGLRVF